MKNLTILFASLAISILCHAQFEKAVFVSGQNLKITNVDFQSDGYSVNGYTYDSISGSYSPYLIKYDNGGNVQFAKSTGDSKTYDCYIYSKQLLTDAGQ